MSLGSAIKLCRTQKNIPQDKLAKDVGVSIQYISLLENDKRDPSLAVAERISAALKVPLTVLIFLGTEREMLTEISADTANKLSTLLLKLISQE